MTGYIISDSEPTNGKEYAFFRIKSDAEEKIKKHKNTKLYRVNATQINIYPKNTSQLYTNKFDLR